MPMPTCMGPPVPAWPKAGIANHALRTTSGSGGGAAFHRLARVNPTPLGGLRQAEMAARRPAVAVFPGHQGPDGCTIATQSQVLPTCGLAERGAAKLPCRRNLTTLLGNEPAGIRMINRRKLAIALVIMVLSGLAVPAC